MTWRLNEAGVRAVLNSGPVLAWVTREGKRVAQSVQQATPVGESHDALYSVGSTRAIPAPDGAVVTVYSTDPFWHLIEFGSKNNPPYAPMRRGALRAGYRLVDVRGAA